MSKKEIIILIVTFILVMLISALITSSNSDSKKESVELQVGDYVLKYGTYKGIGTEYNYDTNKNEEKEITLILAKDKINNQTYEVKGLSLYVNGIEMYKITANNKFTLLAGEGVDFVYEK